MRLLATIQHVLICLLVSFSKNEVVAFRQGSQNNYRNSLNLLHSTSSSRFSVRHIIETKSWKGTPVTTRYVHFRSTRTQCWVQSWRKDLQENEPPGTIATDPKSLNQRIMGLGRKYNWLGILRLHEEHGDKFNAVNYSTSMVQLARIRNTDTNDRLFLSFFSKLAQEVESDRLNFGNRQLVNILHGCAKMRLKSSSERSLILKRLSHIRMAEETGNPQEIANSLWSYATLGVQVPALMSEVEKNAEYLVDNGNPQAIVNSLWSYARLGVQCPNLMSQVEKNAEYLVDRGKPQDTANSLWSYATLGVQCPNLMSEVEKNVDYLVENGKPQEIANSLWSYARLGVQCPNLMAKVEENAGHVVYNGRPQAVANSLWSFATLGVQCPNLMSQVQKNAAYLVENGNPQEIANSLWSFATLGVRCPNLMSEVEKYSSYLVDNGKPQAIANSLWSYATLGAKCPNLMFEVEQHAAYLVDNGRPQAIANSLWSFATLGAQCPNLMYQVENHAADLVENGKPQEIANILWSYAKLGVHCPNLMSEVEKNAEYLLDKGKPQEIASSLWSYATLGVQCPNLMSAVEKNAGYLVDNSKPQAISNSLWSYATLGVQCPNLMSLVEKNAGYLVENGKPQEIANSLWSYATLGVPCPNLTDTVQRNIDTFLDEMNVQQLSNIFWALAVLNGVSVNDVVAEKLWGKLSHSIEDIGTSSGKNQLLQALVFSELISHDMIPPALADDMQVEQYSITTSKSQIALGRALEEIGFLHEEEVSPFPNGSRLAKTDLLAIDIANTREKISIEFDGPYHYLRDASTGELLTAENGPTKAKRRFLKRQGWQVINIDYREWNRACKGSKEVIHTFLRDFLQGAEQVKQERRQTGAPPKTYALWTEAELSRKSVVDLKELLRSAGLRVSGNKAELVARLARAEK